MKSCPACANPIERGGRRGGPLPTYCSTECKNQVRRDRERRNGVAERNKERERARKERERTQRPTSSCPHCGDAMAGPWRKQCGKPECAKRAKADRMREYMRKTRNADGELGDRYREYQRQGHLRQVQTHGHWRKRYPERSARTDAVRRMREKAATVESFAPRVVYERDGWLCRLCRLAIDPTVAWPDSMSASVDHIVPLSKGGKHSLTNVQAAHLGCNSRKRDRLDADLDSGAIIIEGAA